MCKHRALSPEGARWDGRGVRRSAVPKKSRRRAGFGFSLVEVVVVILLLAISIAPMVRAFMPAVASTGAERQTVTFTNRCRGTLNRIRSLDYGVLAAHAGAQVDLAVLLGGETAAAEETFVLDGISYRPAVVLTNVGGATGGLLDVAVTVGRITLRTLVAEY